MKTYLVDVHWDVAKTYRVEADTRKEAEAKMQSMMDAGELSYYDSGYEATDDTSVECSGEVGKDGREHFYS